MPLTNITSRVKRPQARMRLTRFFMMPVPSPVGGIVGTSRPHMFALPGASTRVVARQGPGHVFADEGDVAVSAGTQGSEDFGGGGRVARGDGDVAQPAAVAAAADGGAFGALQEFLFAPGEQFGQAGGVELVAGAEIGLVGAPGEFVPGADELAVVAAEDAVADRGPQLLRDGAFVFDGEVGDAAAGVEAVGRGDGPGGADVDAAGAAAAVGGRRLVHRQREIKVDLAEEEPRAPVAIDEAGVLADPAQAGVAGEGALEHRRGIDEDAEAEGADLLGDLRRQLLQPVAHELVVVPPQGITGDVGAFAVGQGLPGLVVFAAVIQAHGHHAQGAGYELLRTRALGAMAGHPVHVAVQPHGQPVAQVVFVVTQLDAGDAAALEAGFAGQLADAFGDGVRIAGAVGQGGGGLHGRASIESRPWAPLKHARARTFMTAPRCACSRPGPRSIWAATGSR